MKERGIVFNGDMVCAILDGRKTQTRRPLRKQPGPEDCIAWNEGPTWAFHMVEDINNDNSHMHSWRCPFGQSGDRLWVRESLRSKAEGIVYDADRSIVANWPDHIGASPIRDYIPSIQMPRWAFRIMLEITEVRVERIQEISNHSAEREGIFFSDQIMSANCNGGVHTEVYQGWTDEEWGDVETPSDFEPYHTPKEAFRILWDSVYGDRGFGWDTNCWIWAISFKQVDHD